MKHHTRPKAFSLIELVITIGIIAIVAAIAVPAYAKHRSNMQLKASVDQVAAALRDAQSTARALADGAVVDQAAVTNLPASTNRFTVYALRGGTPSAVKSGEAQFFNVAVATSATNNNHSQNQDGTDIITTDEGGSAVPTNQKVGAFVEVSDVNQRPTRVYFGQDGSLLNSNGENLKFSNGDRAYVVKVSAQGTVTVVEGATE